MSAWDHLKPNLLSIKANASHRFFFPTCNQLVNTLDSQEEMGINFYLLEIQLPVEYCLWCLAYQPYYENSVWWARNIYIAIWQHTKLKKKKVFPILPLTVNKKNKTKITQRSWSKQQIHIPHAITCRENWGDEARECWQCFLLQVAGLWMAFIKMPTPLFCFPLVNACSFSSDNKGLFQTNWWNVHPCLESRALSVCSGAARPSAPTSQACQPQVC